MPSNTKPLTVYLARVEKIPSTKEDVVYGIRIGGMNVDVVGSDKSPGRTVLQK